jgi:uncharacterized protein
MIPPTYSAAFYVAAYQMQPHPEGGYYAETYRATETIARADLPDRFSGDRVFGTAIYFLLESHHVSMLHRIDADEVWHFYAGGPLDVFMIDPATGVLRTVRLGQQPDLGHVFQAVVPAGWWFGSAPAAGSPYSLVGCTVAPGFDFGGFELADQQTLLAQFPRHETVIKQLTRSA